jgi:hypothetical protein
MTMAGVGVADADDTHNYLLEFVSGFPSSVARALSHKHGEAAEVGWRVDSGINPDPG